MKDKKIAIVSGGGRLPFLVVNDLHNQGYDIFVVGLKDLCDRTMNPDLWLRLGQVGTALKELKKRNIKQIFFIGAMSVPDFSKLRPDLLTIKILAKILLHQNGDDSLLRALIKEIELLGFTYVTPQKLCPSLTFSPGIQTRTKPSKDDLKDIERGIVVSKTIGKLDIGHSVVVHHRVLAIEAIEGTQRMLKRVIELRKDYKKRGGILAKMLKPNQDLRVDIPAIGVDTIKDIINAKLNGIVIDAHNCWAIDKEELIAIANKNKIFIVAK